MADHSVLIHFQDGAFQRALLKDSFLFGDIVRYVPQSPVNDRRCSLRIPFIKEVKVDQLGIRRASDLSTRGLYVEALVVYPLGSILPIDFELEETRVSLKAKVAHIDEGIGMGLEFYRVPTSTRFRLEALIKKNHSSEWAVPSPRRQSSDRRNNEASFSPSRRQKTLKARDQDRRQEGTSFQKVQVEVKLDQVKTIFFLHDEDKIIPLQEVSLESHRPAVIEFRDGEEIPGTISDLSPEPLGFFVELQTKDQRAFTAYVVKSAVKHITYL